MNRKPPPRMTVADFLAWDGPGKFELVDGDLRAMAPASATHGVIQARLSQLLGQHLAAASSICRVVAEPAIAVRIRSNVNTRIPDLGVTCAPIRAGDVLLPSPILLIEIQSPNNAADTWDNVWAYTTIPTVREIVIVHSTRLLAEVLQRDADGNWAANPTEIGPDEVLTLASVDYAVPLKDAYAGTYLLEPGADAGG